MQFVGHVSVRMPICLLTPNAWRDNLSAIGWKHISKNAVVSLFIQGRFQIETSILFHGQNGGIINWC